MLVGKMAMYERVSIALTTTTVVNGTIEAVTAERGRVLAAAYLWACQLAGAYSTVLRPKIP